MLSLYTAEIKEYLKCDDVVDFDKPEVKALADKLFAETEGGTITSCFIEMFFVVFLFTLCMKGLG